MGSDRRTNAYFDLNGETIQNRNKMTIIEVAIGLFSYNGYSAVSVREIARQVGIKESSLYNHFRSKEEILQTIFHNFRMDIAKITPPLESLDAIVAVMEPEAFMKRGFQNFMEHIQAPDMEQIWRIVYIEKVRNPLARDIFVNDIVGKITDFMETVFKKYASIKKIKPLNPRTLAVNYQYALFQMVALYVLQRLDGEETASLEKTMKEHIEFFISQIRIE